MQFHGILAVPSPPFRDETKVPRSQSPTRTDITFYVLVALVDTMRLYGIQSPDPVALRSFSSIIFACKCGMWLLGSIHSSCQSRIFLSFFLSFFPSPPTWNCRKSAETLPHRTFKLQHTLLEKVDLVTMPWNFWHQSNSDIDHRQIGTCCACSKSGTFLFAPLLAIVLWLQYRVKIAQHRLRAIAVLALAAGAGHYSSITVYNLTF